jgi:hypothetical protein
MKLARITKPPRSAQVRVMLSGDLNASLEHYAQYYEHIHDDTVDTRERSFRRFFAPSSTQTVSSSRGRAPLRGSQPHSRTVSNQRQEQETGVTCLIEVPADVNGMDPASLWERPRLTGQDGYGDHRHNKARRVRR